MSNKMLDNLLFAWYTSQAVNEESSAMRCK